MFDSCPMRVRVKAYMYRDNWDSQNSVAYSNLWVLWFLEVVCCPFLGSSSTPFIMGFWGFCGLLAFSPNQRPWKKNVWQDVRSLKWPNYSHDSTLPHAKYSHHRADPDKASWHSEKESVEVLVAHAIPQSHLSYLVVIHGGLFQMSFTATFPKRW